MKAKKLLICASLLVTGILPSYAQYSNATLNNAWIAGDSEFALYLIFDGNGNVDEVGIFDGMTGPVGTYTVDASGAFAGTLDGLGEMSFEGQLTSETFAQIEFFDGTGSVGLFDLNKVSNLAALMDTLTGVLYDSVNQVTKNVEIALNNQGEITELIGIEGLIEGKIFTENGVFTGFIVTDYPDCEWQNFRILGSYADNNLVGMLELDCQAHGSVNLERIGGTSSIESLNYKSNYAIVVSPNPVTSNQLVLKIEAFDFSKLNIELIDNQGKTLKIFDKLYNLSNSNNIDITIPDHITNGLYFIKIKADNNVFLKKVILCRD